MTSKKQLKRRNHTVNKSYLRRFANADGRLTQVELPGGKRVLVSITDATVRKDFYLLTLPDGTQSDVAEDAFSVLESAATEAICSLVDQGTWPIPSRVRQDIAGWVALQYLRGPWVRQLGREIAEGFSGAGVPIGTGAGEQITVTMSAAGVDELTGARLQLDLIQRQLPEVAKMLCDRDWILTFYEIRGLATSDTPVVLRPPVDHSEFLGVGIANAGEIHVPLDRHVGLSMGSEGTGDLRMCGVAKTALYLNDAMAKNARKYIFHHPEDDPLRGLELPGPRTRELATPAEAGAFVKDLFQ